MGIDRSIVDQALEMSPEPALRGIYGGDVKVTSGGRSISIKGVLRADKSRSDGKWIACDWQGGGIGDNIALLKYVAGLSFVDAVMDLTGQTPIVDGVATRPTIARRLTAQRGSYDQTPDLVIPRFLGDFSQARGYLIGRGISTETIDRAHGLKLLAATVNSVCFLGRNRHGSLRYIAHRYYHPQPVPDDPETTRTKKDEVGSSKVHCFWLPPDIARPWTTWIVEGGTNALALADMLACDTSPFHDGGPQNPLILTTGGVAMREWIRNRTTMDLLKTGGRVVMVGENESGDTPEKTQKKQQATHALREKVIASLLEATGRQADLIYPPAEFGDVADIQADVVRRRHEAEDAAHAARMRDEPPPPPPEPPVRITRPALRPGQSYPSARPRLILPWPR